jgi:hypothetical protein
MNAIKPPQRPTALVDQIRRHEQASRTYDRLFELAMSRGDWKAAERLGRIADRAHATAQFSL